MRLRRVGGRGGWSVREDAILTLSAGAPSCLELRGSAQKARNRQFRPHLPVQQLPSVLPEHNAFVNLSRPRTAEVASPALALAVTNISFHVLLDVVIVVWVADNKYEDEAGQFEVANQVLRVKLDGVDPIAPILTAVWQLAPRCRSSLDTQN